MSQPRPDSLHEQHHLDAFDELDTDSLYDDPSGFSDGPAPTPHEAIHSGGHDAIHQDGHEPSWGEFWDFFEIFQDAIVAGTVAGFILGMLSVYVVSRNMVFMSAAVSQVAGLGLAVGFLIAGQFALAASLMGTLFAFIFTVVLVLATVTGRAGSGPRRDSVLGIGFVIGMAGTLIVGGHIPQELHDVNALLFGSAVAVLPEELTQLLWAGGLLVATHILLYRGFMAVTLTREDSLVRGLPVRRLEIILWVSLALSMALTTKILGALPTFAFSVAPAMAGLRATRSMPAALVLAAILGATGGFIGYVGAFFYHLPVGAMQAGVTVLLMMAVLLIAEPIRWLRRKPEEHAHC